MKILIVIDYYQPVLGYSDSFLASNFKKMGHEVKVLTSNFYFPFPNYDSTVKKVLGSRQLSAGVEIYDGIEITRQKMIKEVFARAIFSGHTEFLKAYQPDLVLVNKAASYNAVRLCQLKKNFNYKLYCYDSHLPSELERENVLLKKIVYFIFRFFFAELINSKIDKFIAVQEKTEDVMKKYYGVKKNIVVIPLGTDIERFKYSVDERLNIRKKYKIKNDDFVIIYTGKVIESKGVKILFEAFNYLCKDILNIKLFIVGEGSKEYVDSCLSRLDKQYHNQVIWVEFQRPENLFKFYSSADIGVWPLQESTSMNDAAANSLPFIANDTIGDKTRIGNKNALLYKKGNSKELAKKIKYLYNNAEMRKVMAKRGRELAEKKLSWKNTAAKFLE
ncbi:MAG: glycosyltransferase family 4 protein [Candidatus Daviesbacteria bacterium]|nr:glycosyltransferase family 4 protein [Candidatus Daviesbacteria bacterium]